jgi:hypothetical protein
VGNSGEARRLFRDFIPTRQLAVPAPDSATDAAMVRQHTSLKSSERNGNIWVEKPIL